MLFDKAQGELSVNVYLALAHVRPLDCIAPQDDVVDQRKSYQGVPRTRGLLSSLEVGNVENTEGSDSKTKLI